jgi:hypothetical protein
MRGCSDGPFESPRGTVGMNPTARMTRFYGANYAVVRYISMVYG